MPTPLNGRKYATSSVTYNNNGGSLAASWTTAQNNWNNANNFKFTSGSSTTFVANTVNDNTVTWDGITKATFNSTTGIISQNLCYLNTYYTSQIRYTQDIINGIATHEFGHAIGLAHSTSSDSVMYPATFDTDGALVRSNTPSADDITAINGLYAPSTSAASFSAIEDSSGTEHITVHPSWAYHYKDHRDLYRHADLVVEGIVSEEHGTVKLGLHPFHHYSTCSVLVDEVLQGDSSLEGDYILVRQLGGGSSMAAASCPTCQHH